MWSSKIRWSCSMRLREPQVTPHFREESRSPKACDLSSHFEACPPALELVLGLCETGSRELIHKHLILAHLTSAL